MINSKSLKDFKKQSKLEQICVTITYNLFTKHFRYLLKLYGWAKLLRNDYDWDYSSIYAILEYKLKRIEKALVNGHAEHEEKYLKALKIAIKLAGRLNRFDYSERCFRKHDDKWGEAKYWFTPNQDRNTSTWNSQRPKAIFEKDKKQERKEFSELMDLEYNARKREQRWLYSILEKYQEYWWD